LGKGPETLVDGEVLSHGLSLFLNNDEKLREK